MANPEHLKILRQGVEVWNRWRVDEQVHRPELSGASLESHNLEEVDLRGAVLVEADLFRSDVSWADLRGASLENSDLRAVRAIDANFAGADLRDSNLENAVLIRASFQMADLEGANLAHATVGQTQFGTVDLSKAMSREDVRHSSASMIGVDTLYRSEGAFGPALQV